MGMLQMEGRRCLSTSLVLAHCCAQKNRVETFFWTSFAPDIWSTSAWSSHITKGKASYSVMVLWVTKSEMTHQKCTQKCTTLEPREIKTWWYTLDTHMLHNRPLSKTHNKGWGNYDLQLQLQSAFPVKWITTSFESHWISHSNYPLHWMKTGI